MRGTESHCRVFCSSRRAILSAGVKNGTKMLIRMLTTARSPYTSVTYYLRNMKATSGCLLRAVILESLQHVKPFTACCLFWFCFHVISQEFSETATGTDTWRPHSQKKVCTKNKMSSKQKINPSVKWTPTFINTET